MQITNKRQMYELLSSGKFGNTMPIWWSFVDWYNTVDFSVRRQFGIRQLGIRKPGWYNKSFAEIIQLCNQLVGMDYIIQESTDNSKLTLQGEFYQTPEGEYTLHYSLDIKLPMRPALRDYGQNVKGIAVFELLRKYMCQNSLDDLEILRQEYPTAVVEFSCYTINVGTLSNRNTIIWEVRDY